MFPLNILIKLTQKEELKIQIMNWNTLESNIFKALQFLNNFLF